METFLSEFPVRVHSLADLNLRKVFPEKGKTFAENARGKNLFYSKYWDGLILAEDSGLEIDFLQGDPGVLSARFSGPGSTDRKNIDKVLELMKNAPQKKRNARFVSHMVLSQKTKIINEIEEYVKGLITNDPRGRMGFGYDPIFYYPLLKKTFAEIRPEEKNKVSHRGKALKKLMEFLECYF